MSEPYLFHLRAYYGKGAKSPKTPGGFAIQTWHKGPHSRDMELGILKRRGDIGRVDQGRANRFGDITWTTVWIEE